MGLFKGNHTCPVISLDESWSSILWLLIDENCPFLPPIDATVLVVGNFTFYEINRIVSGAFTAATYITIFTLMGMYSMNMTRSNEQVKYVGV